MSWEKKNYRIPFLSFQCLLKIRVMVVRARSKRHRRHWNNITIILAHFLTCLTRSSNWVSFRSFGERVQSALPASFLFYYSPKQKVIIIKNSSYINLFVFDKDFLGLIFIFDKGVLGILTIFDFRFLDLIFIFDESFLRLIFLYDLFLSIINCFSSLFFVVCLVLLISLMIYVLTIFLLFSLTFFFLLCIFSFLQLLFATKHNTPFLLRMHSFLQHNVPDFYYSLFLPQSSCLPLLHYTLEK